MTEKLLFLLGFDIGSGGGGGVMDKMKVSWKLLLLFVLVLRLVMDDVSRKREEFSRASGNCELVEL